MRKRRRLADKLTISVCAVLVAFSAFFYAPMDVEAAELGSYENSLSASSSLDGTMYETSLYEFSLGRLSFDYTFSNDVYYLVDMDSLLEFNFSRPVILRHLNYALSGNSIYYRSAVTSPWQGELFSISSDLKFVLKGSELNNSSFLITFRTLLNDYDLLVNCDLTFKYNINSITPLTGAESSTYQQGYNAGYSVGEQAGHDIGYSNGYEVGFEQGENQGYESGFEAGQDSVDTKSYYDAGYSAGYNAGYSLGYEEGYDEGYSKALKSVQGSAGQWGSPMFVGTPTEIKRYGQGFYVSSYGLLDMEEYQSGVNGYFYNTVPGTYDGHTIISYNIPFYSFNNGLVKIDSDKFQVDFGLRDLDIRVECDDGNGTELANLFESRLSEVYIVYNGRKYYGNYDIGTGYVEFDFIAEGIGNPTYLNTGSMTICFDIHNTVTLVTDADVSHFISAKYYNVLECSLGIPSNSYAIYIRPYLVNDRVSANIQDQTNSLTNGFNDSKGNSVNSDFSSGLNDFETAEDSLFATATTGLKDFTFFDFQSVPAMVTGMSFVGSIMSGWFTQAGGASGVGIVLSILFSIMLVAMVLGLYRWYQSKGGKD